MHAKLSESYRILSIDLKNLLCACVFETLIKFLFLLNSAYSQTIFSQNRELKMFNCSFSLF